MLNLSSYLKSIEGQIATMRGNGKTKQALIDLVKTSIEKNKATTIKYLADNLKISTQQVHQTLKRTPELKKIKHNGRVLVVLASMVNSK